MSSNRAGCFFVVILFLLLTGCTGGPGPEEVAKGYLSSLDQLKFEDAAQFVSDDSKENLKLIKGLYADLKPQEQKKFQVSDWKITGTKETGDSAVVDFSFEKQKGSLVLKKIGGAWKVDLRRPF